MKLKIHNKYYDVSIDKPWRLISKSFDDFKKLSAGEQNVIKKQALDKINLEIKEIEDRIELKSEFVKDLLNEGKIQETWDICQLLLLLDRKDRLLK